VDLAVVHIRINSNITIYNKYFNKADRSDSYKKTILYGVFWEETKGSNVLKSGLMSADSIKVFIPHNPHKASYQEPKAFTGNQSGWTLQREDIIVKGIIADEFVSVADLQKRFDNVHMITNIDNLDFGSPNMRHFKVGGS